MAAKGSKRAPKAPKTETSEALVVQNSGAFAEAVGFGQSGVGFPQNGQPTETISSVNTLYKNMRWYLVSNFRQALSQAYVEIALVQTIVNIPVDDGLRGGVTLKSKQLSEEELEALHTKMKREKDLSVAGQAAKWNRLYGGAGIMVLTDQDPEEPLDVEALTDEKLRFRAIDLWEMFWDQQNVEGYDVQLQEDVVSMYNYYGQQVDKSRIMRLTGLTPPSFIRPRLRGWGFSVVESLIRSMNQYLKSTDLAFEVLDEFKLDVYKMKNLVNTLMSPNGATKVKERIALANWLKNYQNALVMDAEDDFDHKQLSFTGLAEAMREIRMEVASAMRMPLTKLFGISAAGFNSGEDDIEVYNSMVESEVREKLEFDILRMAELRCQQLFGMIPDDLTLEFEPLRVLSSEQEENVKTSKFTRALSARQAGELTQKEFRDICNKGDLYDIVLDTDDATLGELEEEADANAEAQQKAAVAAGGGAGGKGKAPAAKEPKEPKNQNAWEESKHPRADDGKFGEGGGGSSDGGGGESAKPGKGAAESMTQIDEKGQIKLKQPKSVVEATQLVKEMLVHFKAAMSAAEKPDATPSEKMRAQHASRQLLRAQKLGEKVVAVAKASQPKAAEGAEESLEDLQARKVKLEKQLAESQARQAELKKHLAEIQGDKKENALAEPWSIFDLGERARVRNSADFDRASYEADGGDAWIDPRREKLYSNPGNVDEALWSKAKAASQAAFGKVKWQFVTWWYKKQGGTF